MGFLMRLRHRFRFLGGVAGAVSHAELGPYAGAPRDPSLRVDDEKAYSTVRYTTERVAYTTTHATGGSCSRCGRPTVESHQIDYVQGERTRATLGAVRICRECAADSWLHRSRSAKRQPDKA